MPKALDLTPPVLEQDFLLLRQALKRCIVAAAPTAIVYERWPLKFDIGQTAKLLKSSLDNDRIHAWILGIDSAIPSEQKIGGREIVWDLTFKIWGLIGYQYGVDSDNPQNTIEKEYKDLVRIIRVNKVHLSLDNTQCLKDVGFLQFNSITAEGFGDTDIILARGELNIKIREDV